MKSKKAFLQISFAWLFAIIVGMVILFLAIYASTKIIKTEQIALDVETAKEIGVLLNPLETGFETGKTNSITPKSANVKLDTILDGSILSLLIRGAGRKSVFYF